MVRIRRFNKPLTLALTALGILGLAGTAQASSLSDGTTGALVIAMSGGSMGGGSGMGHETGVGMGGYSMQKKTPEDKMGKHANQQGMSHSSGMSNQSGMSQDSNMKGKDSMGHMMDNMGKSKGDMESGDSMKKSGKW